MILVIIVPQWYNDIQEGSTTVFGLDQQMKLPITKYKTYDPTTFKDWKFQDLNAIGNLIEQLPWRRKNIELDCYNLTCSVGRLNLFSPHSCLRSQVKELVIILCFTL